SKRDWSSDVCSSDLLHRHRISTALQCWPEFPNQIVLQQILPPSNLLIREARTDPSMRLFSQARKSATFPPECSNALEPSRRTLRSEERRVGNKCKPE